jgi:hypothetical protein
MKSQVFVLAGRVNAMAKTILVPLNAENKMAVPLVSLERLVSPGDRIVFLAASPRGVLDRFVSQLSLIQTGLDAAVLCDEHRARLFADEQLARLEREVVRPARRLFSKAGVAIDLHLYSGPLGRVIKRYRETGEIVLMPASSWSDAVNNFPAAVSNWFAWRRHHSPPRLGDRVNER